MHFSIVLFADCCTVSTRREFTLNNSHNRFLFWCKYCGKTVFDCGTRHAVCIFYDIFTSARKDYVFQFTQEVMNGF